MARALEGDADDVAHGVLGSVILAIGSRVRAGVIRLGLDLRLRLGLGLGLGHGFLERHAHAADRLDARRLDVPVVAEHAEGRGDGVELSSKRRHGAEYD